MGDGLDDLENYAPDATVAAALRDWAELLGGTVQRPRRPRRARGYTPALLFTIILKVPGGPGRLIGRKLLVKVLPAAGAARREPARHELALLSCPTFAERHLVRQPYRPYPLTDGRYLMFQEVANGADDMVTLHDLDDEESVSVIRIVHDRMLNGWNSGGRQTAEATVAEYVQRELAALDALDAVHEATRDLGLPGAEEPWLEWAGEQMLPNPLQTVEPGSPFDTEEIDYLYGNSHGDLHGGNVLVPRDAEGRLTPDDFRLVDLNTFDDTAPLTRDLATLMLTTVLRRVADLPPDQAEALTRHLIFPTTPQRPRRLPPVLADLVEAGRQVGDAFARRDDWVPEWRAQYLLSLLCQALTCCTYDNVPAAARRWCFVLAAWALEAYRREFHPPIEPPPAGTTSRWRGGRNEPATIVAPDADRYRHEPPGRRPGQPTGREQVVGTRVDMSWQPPRAAPSVGPPTAAGPAAWHGAGSAPAPRLGTEPTRTLFPERGGNRPAFHHRPVGDNASAPPARAASGGSRLFRSRPAPRHLVAPRSRFVPRSRPAPRGESLPAAPTATAARVGTADGVTTADRAGTASRVRAADRVGTAGRAVGAVVLLGALVALGWLAVPAITTHSSSVLSRREPPAPPAGENPPESPDGQEHGSARQPLADLAQSVARLVQPRDEGAYAFVCLRVWSPDNQGSGTTDLRSYRDERLTWNSRLAGRRTVTVVTEGRPSPSSPPPTPYGEGDLTEVPPWPSTDPAELRDQLARQMGAPERRGAAGTLQEIARLNRYHPLGPAERSALLHQLADTPGIEERGAYRDRADRPGLAFSADDREGRRETLLVDPGSGELLSHETTRVQDNSVLGHQLFLKRGRTDTLSGPSCG
ncbi:hypothetical protein [Micromonospora sp. NPDC047074]|uniref:hypothetical protein n=1 Tax=Micromonospora sp. NPDC047074 TaxID=3154339 RepID=UPI0034012D2A